MRKLKKRWIASGIIIFCLVVFLPALTAIEPAMSQDAAVEGAAVEGAAATGNPETSLEQAVEAPGDGVYFADVLVRSQPVFQVGSLDDLSASQRAAIITRRIASLLERTDGDVEVTASSPDGRSLVTIQANNRVLLTVTEQDAQDFGLPLETLAEEWAQRIDQSLEKPPVVIDVGQRLNATIRQFGRNVITSIPALIGVLIVILVTWLFARIVRYAAFSWAQRTEGDHSSEILIGRLGYGGVWILGSVIALGVWGIDFATMLGALGLTSVAIGFSLKDVLSNYISGVILLAARPFHIGDQVVINGYEGTISQVQLRTTTINTYDGRMIYIPNQEVFSGQHHQQYGRELSP